MEPCHVLVADDEPHIGRIIKMKLEQGPFRVTLAFDGREALGVLEREPDICDADLVDILSSNLCRCTGYQNIIKAVRAARDEMKAAR
jgi:CheY-like chemotaxis protein